MKHPDFLCCPECGSDALVWREDLVKLQSPYDTGVGLRCSNCDREYPYVDGIWVMWSDNLKKLDNESVDENAAIEDKVKWANIQIYDDVSDDYGEHHDGTQPYAETQLFLKAIADDFRTPDGANRQRVLVDVGSATGIGLDIGSNAYDLRVGVDISMSNLKAVAKKGYIPVRADAEKLPFKNNSVDLMTCFATLHHFPNPPAFVQGAGPALVGGGVLMIACEPTQAASKRGPLAEMVWNARKPVYRFLSKYSNRYHLHRNREQQDLNDLAEFNRGLGGFSPEQLDSWLHTAGLKETKVFYGTDPSGFKPYGVPDWKMFVLKALSFQNPLKRSNWVNVTALGKKPLAAQPVVQTEPGPDAKLRVVPEAKKEVHI